MREEFRGFHRSHVVDEECGLRSKRGKGILNRRSKPGKHTGESGVWQWREIVQKSSDCAREMPGRVSIVDVFKGFSPATNLGRVGQRIASLGLVYAFHFFVLFCLNYCLPVSPS